MAAVTLQVPASMPIGFKLANKVSSWNVKRMRLHYSILLYLQWREHSQSLHHFPIPQIWRGKERGVEVFSWLEGDGVLDDDSDDGCYYCYHYFHCY